MHVYGVKVQPITPPPLLPHVMFWLSAQVNSSVAEKKVQVIWSHEKGMSTTMRHSPLLTWCRRLVDLYYDIHQRHVVMVMIIMEKVRDPTVVITRDRKMERL